MGTMYRINKICFENSTILLDWDSVCWQGQFPTFKTALPNGNYDFLVVVKDLKHEQDLKLGSLLHPVESTKFVNEVSPRWDWEFQGSLRRMFSGLPARHKWIQSHNWIEGEGLLKTTTLNEIIQSGPWPPAGRKQAFTVLNAATFQKIVQTYWSAVWNVFMECKERSWGKHRVRAFPYLRWNT
jgi:hypothetical protein